MSYNHPTDPRTADLARKCDQLNRRCCGAAVSILITVVVMAAILASVTAR